MYRNTRTLNNDPHQKSILPCTPLACVKVLEYLQVYNLILPYGNRLHGKTITVINRSEVVGRPLAALLANDGAKVFSVDIDGIQIYSRGRGLKARAHEVEDLKKSKTLEECLSLSDVVISGVPAESYKVDATQLRDGAVCINFSSGKNFDSDQVKQHASIYVPAIGTVTIAVLLRNLIVSTCHDIGIISDFINRLWLTIEHWRKFGWREKLKRGVSRLWQRSVAARGWLMTSRRDKLGESITCI
jgi:methylenetetrahydrofolate dehydrogenase (NAD+)